MNQDEGVKSPISRPLLMIVAAAAIVGFGDLRYDNVAHFFGLGRDLVSNLLGSALAAVVVARRSPPLSG